MVEIPLPHVIDGAFREKLNLVEWENDPELFEAWQTGRTGYPIVDAAMRQIQETGWMHNRARMQEGKSLRKLHRIKDPSLGETSNVKRET